MFFGGLGGGLGGALGSGASSLLMPAVAEFLRQNDVPELMVQVLVDAAALGIGATVGGVPGAAGAFNEAANNALLSSRAIERLMEETGWETIRGCLNSPKCVSLLGTEISAKLFVGLQVTDAIKAAVKGLPDISEQNSTSANYQSSGGITAMNEFFNSLPLVPNSSIQNPNGSVVGQLADHSYVTMYAISTSTEGPTVSIRRPNGSVVKVRF